MCTEFILVSIYFFTILLANFFLFKLLNNYSKKIDSLSSFTNLFKNPEKKNLKEIAFLEFCSINIDSRKNYLKFIENFLKFSSSTGINKNKAVGKKYLEVQDIIIFNNLYDFFYKKNQKSENISYYFKLLKFQYGSIIDKT
jgi:hypothetical protein